MPRHKRGPAPFSRTRENVTPVLLKENYRGHDICAENFAALDRERKNIDRVWSRKLCDAKNANERARVLADERAQTRFLPASILRRKNIKPRASCVDETDAAE
jgi:hypothetical protein